MSTEMKDDYIGGFLDICKSRDRVNFIEEIATQNKEKVWTDKVINIWVNNEGDLESNSVLVKEAVDKLKDTLESTIENGAWNSLKEQFEPLTLERAEAMKKQLLVIYTWLEGTRKKEVEPIVKVNKDLIANEKIVKECSILINEKIEKLNEEVYAARKDSIFKELKSLDDEMFLSIGITTDQNIYDSFIDAKKKTATYDLNKSEKLSATAKKAIKEQFDLVASPLIEAKKLAEKKESDQNFLTRELSKVNTSGSNYILEVSVKDLGAILDSIPTLYSSIEATAINQVTSIIKVCKDGIAQNDKIEKENVQNEIDLQFLMGFNSVDMTSTNIEYLENCLDPMDFHDVDSMLQCNKKKLLSFISDVKNRIQTLKQNQLKNIAVPIVEAVPTTKDEPIIYTSVDLADGNDFTAIGGEIYENIPNEETKQVNLKQYKLSELDIKFISEIKITAENDTVAVAMMSDYISNHLDMNGLEEIK